MKTTKADLKTDYDAVAEAYGHELFHELEHKPLDRQWLREFADEVGERGPICDLGCGPGQIARYLRDRGVEEVFGIDLSPEMVKVARRLNPDIEFRQGDMRALDIEDGGLGGIAAFYSILHAAPEEVPDTLAEWRRVLAPGGWLLVTFHIGDYVKRVDELFGKTIEIDFVFFESAFIERSLAEAGYVNIDPREREPYIGHEYESRRAYIFAQKPID